MQGGYLRGVLPRGASEADVGLMLGGETVQA
jgi:hypothetical protein